MTARRLAPIALLALLAAAPASAPTSTLDRLEHEYAPYVDVADPLGFSLKVRAISSDPYKFWRGTKGFFYDWCKTNAADWLADPMRVPSHGDVHVGNVGTYATDWNRVAFGLVDFDDAIPLPPELDLLDACVTSRLVARTQHLDVDLAAVDRVTFDAYLAGLRSGVPANGLLADDPTVKTLVGKATASYADELAKFCTPDGAFRTSIEKGSKTTELLTPLPIDGLADAIAEACRNDSALAARMLATDAVGIRVRGACVRTRLGSSGSQGLMKILVRLDRPFRDVDGDVILYLKQQIPTAAERAGIATRSDETPGGRAARMIDALARPRPIVNSFATFAGRSFAVGLKEPWSDELDPAKIDSADELLHVSRLIGTALGAAHGTAGNRNAIAARFSPATLARIAERADRYVVDQQAWFESLVNDPHAIALAAQSDAAIRRASGR